MRFFISIIFFIILIASQAHGRIITDQAGRNIKIPQNPKRVVSLAPSITEIIFALNREDCLKGASQFSDFPPQADKLPKVGSYVHLDLEKIVALNPDLCLAIKDGNPVETIRRLESFNIPVFALDPKNLTAVVDAVLKIGEVLNAQTKANALAQNMSRRITRVKNLAAKASEKPGVFFQIGIHPIVSAGTHTFINELVQTAGGINLAAGDVSYPRFSQEQVLSLSPDILIITSMARASIFDEVKAEWQKWPNMPAVKNKRIFLVDSNLVDRPTPRIVQGLEKLFQIIHPEPKVLQ